MKTPKIGISIGDINGISPEIIIKGLSGRGILDWCVPIIYGSSKVVSYHKNIVNKDFRFHSIQNPSKAAKHKVNLINCSQEAFNIELGQGTAQSGQFAALALEVATNDLKSGAIDALVTAPINKKAMQLGGGFPYPGHTEYLTKAFGAKQSLMLMVSDDLRIGLATNHLPVSLVAPQITKALILEKLNIFQKTLKEDFGIERPSIAVLGLNPHAGDSGAIGEEEEKIIRPAIVESKKSGNIVMGPFPADGFFGSREYRKYDGVLAIYHDQGLVPFKLLAFGNGVNFTAGLSGIRTSPDHGTAFNIAGQNIADASSFREALLLAIDLCRNRSDYKEMHKNPVKTQTKKALKEEEDVLPEDEK